MMATEEAWGAAPVFEPGEAQPVPWEDPELSGPAAFYRTLRDLLMRPGKFFQHLEGEGRSEPLAFALIISTGGLLCAFFWLLLALGPGGLSPEDAEAGLGPGVLLALMAGAPLLALARLGVGGLCWWGSVALAGAGRQLTPAWRIFCYAQGGLALMIIPFFGPPVAAIGVLTLLYIGAKQVYGLSNWASIGALAIFLSILFAVGMIILLGLLSALAFLGFLLLLGG
ncbi:MAG: hypothetical protein M0P73_11760 [Syntrophobacterales bacterium]|jgi:hypothetical protein|nr:hypothetical protein [Syntrophobacterales bacterium]